MCYDEKIAPANRETKVLLHIGHIQLSRLCDMIRSTWFIPDNFTFFIPAYEAIHLMQLFFLYANTEI